MCYDPSSGHLYPLSARTMCEANNNTNAILRDCNNNFDQIWTEIPVTGGFRLENANGGYLCASDGVGSIDIVSALSQCSHYHDTWKFELT
jgi:hypothetical protein